MDQLRGDLCSSNDKCSPSDDSSNTSTNLFMLSHIIEIKFQVQNLSKQFNFLGDNFKDFPISSKMDIGTLKKTFNSEEIKFELDKVYNKLQKIESKLLNTTPSQPNKMVENNIGNNNDIKEKEDDLDLKSGEVSELDSVCCSKEDDTKKESNIGNKASCEIDQESKIGSKALYRAFIELTNFNEPSIVKSCAQMLFLYSINLSSNPKLPRYRRIFTNNYSFQNNVENIRGAKNILYAMGFVDQGSFLEWKADTMDGSELNAIVNYCRRNEGCDIEECSSAIMLVKEAAAGLSIIKSSGIWNDQTQKTHIAKASNIESSSSDEERSSPPPPPPPTFASNITSDDEVMFQTPDLRVTSPPIVTKRLKDFPT